MFYDIAIMTYLIKTVDSQRFYLVQDYYETKQYKF